MILISHRGNLFGKNEEKENNPTHIDSIIDSYDVEIDLRMKNGILFLGHDYEQYEVSEEWILKNSSKLWIHCKDVKSLAFCSKHLELNYFWHDADDYTLTSFRYIWAYPGKEVVNDKTILVLPETTHWSWAEVQQFKPMGICSDFVGYYEDV
jgi:hypothetical protein